MQTLAELYAMYPTSKMTAAVMQASWELHVQIAQTGQLDMQFCDLYAWIFNNSSLVCCCGLNSGLRHISLSLEPKGTL